MMKLMTDELKEKFKKFPLYSQDGKGGEAEVVVKYFTPDAQATWLITEGTEDKSGDWELFGLVSLNSYDWEWGYVWLSSLEEVVGPLGLHIERDLHIKEGSKVKDLK